jgi:hypothetical protein
MIWADPCSDAFF